MKNITLPTPATQAPRSQTLTTWLALVAGGLGLHRFYMHGFKDWMGWAHVPPTVLGTYGIWRMRELGMDDRLAWLLAPALGVSLSIAMLSAIVVGLTAAEQWQGGASHPRHLFLFESPWMRVLGVVVAVMIGATVLITTIAFSAQRFFEWT